MGKWLLIKLYNTKCSEVSKMWNQIKYYMDLQNINQETLSKRMKVHSGTVSDFKLGHIKKPSFELMCKFADALNVSLDDLRNKEVKK